MQNLGSLPLSSAGGFAQSHVAAVVKNVVFQAKQQQQVAQRTVGEPAQISP